MLSSVFIRSHVHVLQRHDATYLGFRHLNKPYLLAFSQPSLALKIAAQTNRPDDIALRQHVTTNILAGMTQAQAAYWDAVAAARSDAPAPSEFQVNFAGLLTFTAQVLPVTEMCTLSEISVDDLLDYPMTRNLGVAVVRKVTDDREVPGRTETEVIVIESCTRPVDFRRPMA